MKNIYFVQVERYADIYTDKAYLPYAAGILAANAWTSSIVQNEYRFREFIFLREDVNVVAERMQHPAIVAFSNYCWSTEYNKALAAAIKEKYPQCITVFGGHNVPDDFSLLEQFPYIDILVHGEGEETLKLLFEVLAQGDDLQEVPNISFRADAEEYVRTPTKLPTGLDYPSPYLEGWFDDLMHEHPNITFNAILETSRGCPHRCAYCDWGLLKSKVRLFPIGRVKAEIQWMSAHKIAFIWGADANFGLFDRDLEIADALVAAKEATGYPERMRMNYAKNKYENVFAIIKKFEECNFDRVGATLSFQSLSEEVLKNIGRKNDSIEFYKNLLTQYNNNNMKTYSELILGLPGETYESFTAGIGKLFEIGQHFVFEVYVCILLPNSVLGQKQTKEQFKIKTISTKMIRSHYISREHEITEYHDIIIQTDTLSREMWVQSMAFAEMVKVLHASGYLRVFAIYLYCEKKLPYEQFYRGFFQYLKTKSDSFTARLYETVIKFEIQQSAGDDLEELTFEPCGDIIWDVNEYCALEILNHFDEFFADVNPYLQSFGIEKNIFEDLLKYQKAILRRPNDEEQIIDLKYHIHGFLKDAYVNNIHSPEKRSHRLILRDSHVFTNWPDFGKYVVWYGRMGWSSYKADIRACDDIDEI